MRRTTIFADEDVLDRLREIAKRENMTLSEAIRAALDRYVSRRDRYSAARIGFVDAAVVATAERLRVSRILTTDRRDFSLIRPRHCKAFELLP